jgi:hypothetical protein
VIHKQDYFVESSFYKEKGSVPEDLFVVSVNPKKKKKSLAKTLTNSFISWLMNNFDWLMNLTQRSQITRVEHASEEFFPEAETLYIITHCAVPQHFLYITARKLQI